MYYLFLLFIKTEALEDHIISCLKKYSLVWSSLQTLTINPTHTLLTIKILYLHHCFHEENLIPTSIKHFHAILKSVCRSHTLFFTWKRISCKILKRPLHLETSVCFDSQTQGVSVYLSASLGDFWNRVEWGKMPPPPLPKNNHKIKSR